MSRRRTFRQVLALPQTAAEERWADRYIRQACERIQTTWSPEERYRRQSGFALGDCKAVYRDRDGEVRQRVAFPLVDGSRFECVS